MENIDKRLTIIEFEFNHLMEILKDGTQERWLPGYSADDTSKAHLNRYIWAAKYIRNRRVLDLACGSGFGSYHLAKNGRARKVIAGDNNKQTIKFCKARHSRLPNLEFEYMDAEHFSLQEKIDIIVSFETIEHLKRPKLFLQACSRCLSKDGIVFISTPVSRYPVDIKPNNPYHRVEWNLLEFLKLMKLFFIVQDVYIQPTIKPISASLSLYKKIIVKFNKFINRKEMNFVDLDIISIKDNLSRWQKMINLDLIDAYVIVKCKKRT